MIKTVRGIILRRREATESSLILTVFTDTAGKLNLLAKGARRARSPFLGRVELFTLCHFTYYENARKGLNILSDCDLIEPFPAVRRDLRAFMFACYAAELADMGTGLASRAGGVFTLLKEILSLCGSLSDLRLLRICFELRLLALLGYSLRLDACVRCRAKGRGLKFFSAGAGGMLCGGCAERYRGALTVSPGTVSFLRYLGGVNLPSLFKVKPNAAQAVEAMEMLQRAIVYYLERSPRTLKGLLEVAGGHP